MLIEFFVVGFGRSIWAGSQLGEKKGREWKEKPSVLVIMTGLSIAMLFLLVVYVGFPALWPWMYMGLPEVVRWLAFVVSVAACVFLLWVFKTIGKAGAKHLIISDDMKLVTTGPYSRVRHPMYTGFFLWGITTVLFTDHWGFSGFLVALVVLNFARVSDEEQMLIGNFGEEYRRYMARTNRFLPRARGGL
ncbi:MAG: isoprenylcysteine carboxylmethyltransferase family protein [Pseudomonadales bacterium]|jgi:protein-S-isoprenylcysteine O-methyltransferase Ste14|nr:isoprenylcysteine carboxylmethyltransferase family protein [Pseudomonadales bacterium]MDP6469599.1 isoprenylcysteine carboxylmethyltransferase family protein [Pseudomonadales bacterium]MDP6827440.1 isoprenylcysteine carboxylmethyltransferase family protein [Pseudomonadales bacterium]MDP6972198.1 isoprenylcysteine carboxylmethyltransferase family protein [Pseudomonadales bacterium]|tara:strand:- start:292 stop:861 length:570 start_codon:yes stop_codon:yes gene_type:complete